MKILIIDDDMMFRKYMEKIIRDHYGDVHTLEFAVNGAHGLELMKSFEPVIILTDISMPEMNGLDFIKEAHKRSFEGIIAVLSSYDDFEYVKETLTSGAVDYILKHETKKEGIFELIESCREKYEEKKLQQIKSTQIQSSHDEALRHELLRTCHNPANKSKLVEKLMNSKFENLFYRPFYILINPKEELKYDDNLAGISVKNDYSKLGGTIHLVWEIKSKSEQAYKEDFFQLLERNNLKADETAVSNLKYDFDNMCDAYEEAMDIYFYKLRTKKGSIFYDEFQAEEKEEYYNRFISLCNEVDLFLKKSDGKDWFGNVNKDKFLAKCKSLIYEISKSQLSRVDYFYIMREAYYQLLNHIEPNKRNKIPVLKLQDIKNENLLKLHEKIIHWYESVLDTLVESKNSKNYTDLTKRIMDYVDHNIYENIQLHDIAMELGYSDNHLSKQFKVDTGYRIKEYVNEKKIEKAKPYIKEGELKVYEIAEKFGFGSVAYFCSVFKSVTGETVTMYSKDLMEN